MVRLLCIEAALLISAQNNREVEAIMHQSNFWVVQTAYGKRSMEFAAFQQLCSASPWAGSHHRRRAWQLLHALRSKPIRIGWRLQQAAAVSANAHALERLAQSIPHHLGLSHPGPSQVLL